MIPLSCVKEPNHPIPERKMKADTLKEIPRKAIELPTAALIEGRNGTSKRVRKTRSEAVSFVVCNAICLATSTAAQDYIQLYGGDAKLLTESLERIQQTANCIPVALTPGSTAPPARRGALGPLQNATVPNEYALAYRFGKPHANAIILAWKSLWVRIAPKHPIGDCQLAQAYQPSRQ